MAGVASICLTMLLASHLKAVLSEFKPDDNMKEMENIIERKTTRAIKKLENQFKSTFMAYTSAKDRGKRQQAYGELEHLVNVVKRDSKEKLENSVKGFKFDVSRLSDKETEKVLESAYVRKRRSKDSWGSCKPLCKQRCLPTCNLVCCIAPPYDVPRRTAKRLEKQLGRKSTIKQHAKKKKSTIKTLTTKEKSATKKDKKTHAGVCNSNCQKACLPSCDFRCCFAPKKH